MRPVIRSLLLAALLAAIGVSAPAAQAAALPPIHHVYVLVLENESVATTFGPSSPAPYLAKTLTADGAYLPSYYGTGHASNDNYIAMISGQAPNPFNQADCGFFTDFPVDMQDSSGQQEGGGCVYPASIDTIAGQLDRAHLTWRDYNDSMGADPSREPATCAHPPLNGQDHTQTATAADQYATRHNPFVYFHSIIDDAARCNSHVVNLNPLSADLAGQTPNYVFITPSLCNDGHDSPCANGQPGGLVQADRFLRTWVPAITGSAAFRNDGGLLLVIFDESSQSDSSACCGEVNGPGSPSPGESGPGGGDTGAVAISPYIRPGTVDKVPYNHYTMLRSIEDLFGLSHLGYANLPGETSFGSDLFACAPTAPQSPLRGRLPAGSEFTGARIVHRRGHAAAVLTSVRVSSLSVTVRPRHGRRTTRHAVLTPCRSFAYPLPSGHGTVRLAATVAGAAQTATLRY